MSDTNEQSRHDPDSIAGDGIETVYLTSWAEFLAVVAEQYASRPGARVWRGQSDARWPLQSSLDRLLKTCGRESDPTIREDHLQRFKFAARGRRGANPAPLTTENDWWALAQHYGLATPLLDWTWSPHVALYFAFSEDLGTEARAVFALDQSAIREHSEAGRDSGGSGASGSPFMFVDTLSDENARIVNQAGVFTRAPDGKTVEDWVSEHHWISDEPLLTKFVVPSAGRSDCLRLLNLMNINPLTLFPDLVGASQHCNKFLSELTRESIPRSPVANG